jgi:integrase/recombinase XerD
MDIELERAVLGFRLNNEAKGLSHRTIEWYHQNLVLFQKWIAELIGHKPFLEEITAEQVREYFTHLRTDATAYRGHPFHPIERRPLSPRSIICHYTSLSSFFNWSLREELISHSPMRNVPRPKTPKFIPDPFAENEIRALLQACKDLPDKSSIRATAIIMVLLDSGMRLGELLDMRMSNLDLEHGKVKVIGKGAKERFVYFGKAAKRSLFRYISMARPEPAQGNDFIFLSEEGFKITNRYLAHILKKVSKIANVPKVHPHRFRRTAAIQFIRNGGNIFALQKLLGHETLDMVRHYVELASEDVATAHQKASPVDGWRL